jgi:hypothetical protein
MESSTGFQRVPGSGCSAANGPGDRPAFPADLLVLKQAMIAASAAYMAHKRLPDDATVEAQIDWDMVEKALLRATSAARIAYDCALDLFTASQSEAA